MVKSEVVEADPSLMVESVVVEGDPWTQRVMMTRFLGGGGYKDGMRAKRAQQPIQQPHGHLQSLVTSSLTTVELEMVDLSVANWEKLFTDVDGADTNLVFEKLVSSPTTVDIKPVVEENLIWYKMETITRSEMVIDNCYWMMPERGIMRFRRVRLEVLKEKPRVKIKDMVSRGAPTIAIAATLPLSVKVSNLSELDGLSKDAVAFRVVKLKYLISIRHTAVILADATSKLEEITNKAGAIVFESRGIVYAYIEASEIMLVDNVASNKSSGVYRVEPELPHMQLKKSDKIFIVTYCNTGKLATVDYGIALDVIQVDALETFSARSLLMKLIVNTTESENGVWCLSLTVGSIFNFYVEDIGRDATAKLVFSSSPPKPPDIRSFQNGCRFLELLDLKDCCGISELWVRDFLISYGSLVFLIFGNVKGEFNLWVLGSLASRCRNVRCLKLDELWSPGLRALIERMPQSWLHTSVGHTDAVQGLAPKQAHETSLKLDLEGLSDARKSG